MLGGLELNVDVDDLVCEDEVEVISFDPWGFGSIFDLGYFYALEDEFTVDFGGVLFVYVSGEGHGVAQPGSHDEVGQNYVDIIRGLPQHTPEKVELKNLLLLVLFLVGILRVNFSFVRKCNRFLRFHTLKQQATKGTNSLTLKKMLFSR